MESVPGHRRQLVAAELRMVGEEALVWLGLGRCALGGWTAGARCAEERTTHERDPDRLEDIIPIGIAHLHHF